MSYTTYYERRQNINRREAAKLEEVFAGHGVEKPQQLTVRKLRFAYPDREPQSARGTGARAEVSYGICMVDFDGDRIFLQMKYVQRGITYKRLAKLTQEECRKILEGDIEWMRQSRNKLVKGFYLEMKINRLHPASIVETRKSIYRWKSDYICLKWSVRSIRNNGYNFFRKDCYMIQCLDDGVVELNQKQAVTLPRFIESIFRASDDVQEDALAYVL